MFFPEDTESYREIIDRSFFLQVSGGEIHRDAGSSREDISTIFYRTSDTLSAFLYSSISESYDREVAHTSDDIDLYLDEISMDSVHRSREEFLHRSE